MNKKLSLNIKPGTSNVDRFFLTIAYLQLQWRIGRLTKLAIKEYRQTGIHQYVVLNGGKPFLLSKATFKWHRQHGTIKQEHTIDSIKQIALFTTHKPRP